MSRISALSGTSALALQFAFLVAPDFAIAQKSDNSLPPVQVEAPAPTRQAAAKPTGEGTRAKRAQRAGRQAAVASAPASKPAVGASGLSNSSPTDYKLDNATTATKSNTPILNTPMAVQIVPRAALDDKQVISAQEAVKFVSGVQMPTTPYYDNFLIRGFDNGGKTYRNGLHLYGIVGFEDLAFVDHIEIAKGPTSMLYGRVQPGGLVNYVTKKPEDVAAYSVQQQFGSWGQMRTTVDATGALDKEKTVLYRAIGTFDKGDSFIDYQHHQNWAGYGALTWRPNAEFEANLQFEHYDQKNTNPGYTAQQIPTIGNRPANLPRNWTQNDPAMWANFPGSVNRSLVYFDWTYKLGDNWKISQKFHYNTADEIQSYLLYQGFSAATGLMNRRISYNPFSREDFATNVDLSGEFYTGPLKHKVLLGVDWFDHTEDTFGYNESGSTLNRVPILNVFNPVYGNIDVAAMQGYINAASNNVLYRQHFRDTGVYVQDEISFNERLFVLMGGRYDIARDSASQVYGAVSSACFPTCDGHLVDQPTAEKFSPRLGVLYKLTNELSAYASYSQSLGSSTSAVSFNNTPFPPQTGEQYETGVKASMLDGKLTASLTLFDLYLRNRLTSDPAHPGFSIAVGEVRSSGVEFDIAGQVTSNISLIGSYTYDDAKITADSVASNLGKRWPGVPLSSSSLWAKYENAPGELTGWFCGAGFYLVGDRQGNATNTMQLPGYGRVDAMVGYRTALNGVRWTAQVNVQNLFDAVYFETSNGTYSAYGAPRTILGSLKAQF